MISCLVYFLHDCHSFYVATIDVDNIRRNQSERDISDLLQKRSMNLNIP